MKKFGLLVLLASLFFIFSGCASTAKFDQKYMPKAVPDKPGEKISFSSEDSRLIAQYALQARLENHIGLYWLAEDTIYLNLADSAVFAVHPDQKQARELLDAQAENARSLIDKRVQVALDHEGKGVVRQFVAGVFSYGGQKMMGEIVDNKQKIDVDVKTFETRAVSEEPKCESVKLKGTLTNSRGKATDIDWDFDCAWVPQVVAIKKIPQMLSRVQVSPTGKFYLYGSLLYETGKNKPVGDLLAGYPDVAAVSINPAWTKIAVLRIKGKVCWVEIFPVKFNDQARPVVERIDL